MAGTIPGIGTTGDGAGEPAGVLPGHGDLHGLGVHLGAGVPPGLGDGDHPGHGVHHGAGVLVGDQAGVVVAHIMQTTGLTGEYLIDPAQTGHQIHALVETLLLPEEWDVRVGRECQITIQATTVCMEEALPIIIEVISQIQALILATA